MLHFRFNNINCIRIVGLEIVYNSDWWSRQIHSDRIVWVWESHSD